MPVCPRTQFPRPHFPKCQLGCCPGWAETKTTLGLCLSPKVQGTGGARSGPGTGGGNAGPRPGVKAQWNPEDPRRGTGAGDGVASAVPGPEPGPREVGGEGPAGGARGSRPALCAPSDPPLRDLAPPQIPGGPSAPRPGVAPAGPPAARTHRAPRKNLPSLECPTRGRADSFPESDATTAPEVPPEAARLPGHAQSLGNRRGLETPQAGACWEL